MAFEPRNQGPIETLCREIGFAWDRRLERTDLLVAFVRELVSEIEGVRHVQQMTEKMGGKGPTEASAEALALAARMLEGETTADLIARAAEVHDACHRLNPEDAYPTDHLVDMVSSCASAIRFGLETPCRSRHAAAAANHVWKQVYGVSRFDSHTPDWEKSWARNVLINALVSALPPANAGKHDYWMAGEPDCPREVKAGNGELHTLRCKRCGLDNPRGEICIPAA